MKNINLTLILIVALWSSLNIDSPFRSLFNLDGVDNPGGVIATGDPESDPIMIMEPPPRN